MNPSNALTCPWSDWAPGTVQFCEERLCAVIAEPSNTWSSLGYVAIGVWLLATHARRSRDLRLWGVGVSEILIGVGSFAFHGTGSFAGEFLDQVGMFLLSCLILAYAAGRILRWTPGATAALYAGLTVASALALLVVRPIGIPLFALQLNLGLLLELTRGREWTTPATRRILYSGLGVFVVSFAIWVLDFTGVVCDPSNHLVTGHAVWHVLNAIVIARLYRYYAASFEGAQPLSPGVGVAGA